jgi:prolipoprotein diacylglyceryltransferase
MKDKKFEPISLFVIFIFCLLNCFISIHEDNDNALSGWVVAALMTFYGYIPFFVETFKDLKKNDDNDLNIS